MTIWPVVTGRPSNGLQFPSQVGEQWINPCMVSHARLGLVRVTSASCFLPALCPPCLPFARVERPKEQTFVSPASILYGEGKKEAFALTTCIDRFLRERITDLDFKPRWLDGTRFYNTKVIFKIYKIKDRLIESINAKKREMDETYHRNLVNLIFAEKSKDKRVETIPYFSSRKRCFPINQFWRMERTYTHTYTYPSFIVDSNVMASVTEHCNIS